MLKQEGWDRPVRCSEEGKEDIGSPPELPAPGSPLPTSSAMEPTASENDFVSPHSTLHTSNYLDAGYEVKSAFPEWDAVLERMAAEIKVRHYSRKTLRTYANWSRGFQRFLRNKPPDQLATADMKEYLTYLAVTRHVATDARLRRRGSLDIAPPRHNVETPQH